MATMATSHGLSVLTNSCIKSPVNPATGLSASFEERPAVPNRQSDNDDCDREADEIYENEVGGRIGNFLRNVPLEEYASQLHLLSDDEFYDRLIALKQEQKKTLIRCEQIYKEKLAQEGKCSTQTAVDYLFDRNDNGRPMNGHVSDSEDSMLVNGVTRSTASDYVRDMSSKPPVPLRQGPRTNAILSETLPVRSRAFQNRPNSAPVGFRRSRSQSFDDDEWRKHMYTSGDESGDDEEKLRRSSLHRSREDIETALSKIDDMWNNFSVEDYVTGGRRRHSFSSSTKKTKKQKHERIEDNWRHRLTIPQPFKMTLRDELKEKKTTRAQYEVAQARLDREKEEEAECQKKFKASPAPAHIYLPLYDEIREKNEARRRYVKEYCTEMLKSQVKPFNFMTREEEKYKHKVASAPGSPMPDRREKTTFKANPVPDYLYDNTVNDKLIEEEEYRKIRMRMRSDELMREASLPPNMAARERMKEQKQKEKAMRAKRQRRFRPKINRHIPDYDALYRQFQKELARRKCDQESTIVEPFHLETHTLSSRREKVLRDMERDEETLKENRWPYKSLRTPTFSEMGTFDQSYAGGMPSSLDWIPTKTTRGSQLRESSTKDRLHSLTRQEEEEFEEGRRHRIRNVKLQRAIAERAVSADSERGRRETVRSRLRRMRESERQRLEEYEKELRLIKEKVDRRPLLVERQSQVNAKKSAEKKFTATLHKVGLNEDFINNHSSATVSQVLDTSEYYDDTFDDTAGKSSDMD